MPAGLVREVPHNAVHLCVDMQRMFVEETAWRTPWADRIMPQVVRLCAHRPDRLCFTRFIPASRPGDGRGTWKGYWERWPSMTLDGLGPEMVEIARPLQVFVPPARLLDKSIYSPWLGTDLDHALRDGGVDTLIVTGAETDVCVLATVLGAVDLGYRIIVATDAVCGSADESHDHILGLYTSRFTQQVETASTDDICHAWS